MPFLVIPGVMWLKGKAVYLVAAGAVSVATAIGVAIGKKTKK